MRKIANWTKASVLAMFLCGSMHNSNADDRVGSVAKGVNNSSNASVGSSTDVALNNDLALKKYSDQVYKSFGFSKGVKLNKEVFDKAFKGYLNLKQSGQLTGNKDVLSICDFSLSSNVPRLWVLDVKSRKVLFNTLVAHGQGSGEEFATAFSNIEGSHQSSVGFFTTANTYYGDKGYSLKLEGKDPGYNCQAFSRAIVIHAADYVSYDFIKANKRLGRSWGCPALPEKLNRPIIDVIKGGSALFIYNGQPKYLASSKWLRKYPNIDASIQNLGKEANSTTMLADLNDNKVSVDSVPVKLPVKRTEAPMPIEAYFN